ncbi:hypothetical protein ACXR2T_07595 [Leucobacter sp. HY1910]
MNKSSPSSPALRKLVSARELAEAWSISEREIAEKARTRELPSYKIGRLVRFDPAECEKHLLSVFRPTLR